MATLKRVEVILYVRTLNTPYKSLGNERGGSKAQTGNR